MSRTAQIFLLLLISFNLGLNNCLAFGKNPPATVFLGSRELSSKVKFIEEKKVIYINHSFLEEIFRTKTEWEIKKSLIKIKCDNLKIEFQRESSMLNINGEKHKLTNPIFEQGDNLWFPLEFYQLLGIKESSREDRRLKLKWEESSLLRLDMIEFQGRPALEIILTGAIDFKHFLLPDPDRLVCQFPATKIHSNAVSRLKGFRNGLIKKVRFNQDDTGLLTLAFDLTVSTGYEAILDPDFPERVLLVFNYFLEDLSLFHHEAETKINIKTSAPADFKIIQNDGRNLVIDLENAVLKTKKSNIAGDGELIETISLGQIEANKIRINAKLLKAEELFVALAPDDPNLLQVKTIQLITGIDWTSHKLGNQLVVDSDGELWAKVQKVSNAQQIQIDFEYARLHPDLAIPKLSGNLGKAVHIKAIGSNQVRLVIDLNYFHGFESELSANKRQMRVLLKDSPVVNKTFIIDPGHGGQDNGAMGKKGTLEKELNLEVSLRLKDLLEEAGAKVVLTRFDDTFISLYERAFLANFLMADFFISIHTNSHTKAQTEGIEVFYYPNHLHAGPLATRILDSMVRETGLKKLAVKTNNFAVIRETQMPGVLLELGFISNSQEELILRTEEFKNNAARGIFQGIVDFPQ